MMPAMDSAAPTAISSGATCSSVAGVRRERLNGSGDGALPAAAVRTTDPEESGAEERDRDRFRRHVDEVFALEVARREAGIVRGGIREAIAELVVGADGFDE